MSRSPRRDPGPSPRKLSGKGYAGRWNRSRVLDPILVRAVAAGIAIAYVAGVVFVQARGRLPIGRRSEFRLEDSPPKALQLLWEAAFLLPNLYPFAAALLPAWTYGTVLNFSFPLDAVAQLFGLGLWCFGGALALWSAKVLGRHMIVQIAVVQDHELITTGPYARVRHPTYLAVMCMVGGLALFFLSSVLGLFFLLAVALANYRARKEERLLSSEQGFGQRYCEYLARTGRFLPRLRV